MTTLEQTARAGERLAPVRRTYTYLVAFVSLGVVLFGISSLVDTLLRLWLDNPAGAYGAGGFSRSIASSAGLLLVATPIFLIHWALAQRHREEAGERASLLRKGFLYAATAWSLASLLGYTYLLIDSLLETVLGAPPQDAGALPAQWLTTIVLAAMHAGLVLYWFAVLQSDEDFGAESTSARIVRQIFMVLAGLAGLALLLWGGAGLIQLALRLLVDITSPTAGGAWWQTLLASALAQVIVGGWLAYNNRAQWQGIVARRPAEGQTALRRFYLYAAVVIGAIAALTPAALLLRELLLMVFGDAGGSLPLLLNRLITPVSFIPVGVAIWLWHWNVLRREADAYGESHQGATVRRLYYYLVAATGLALLWVGSVEILNALIDAWFSAGAGSGSVGPGGIWHEPLANGLSLVLVGAPIWALHWRSVQRRAERADAQGDAERDALPRKIYLYGVSLIAALILLFQLAQVIYRLLLLLMGDAGASLVSAETAHQLADCLVAGILWAVHLLAIRADARLDKVTEQARTPAAHPEQAEAAAVPAGERRLMLEQRRLALEAELESIRRELAALPTESEA